MNQSWQSIKTAFPTSIANRADLLPKTAHELRREYIVTWSAWLQGFRRPI
jgi:hypothetical protein